MQVKFIAFQNIHLDLTLIFLEFPTFSQKISCQMPFYIVKSTFTELPQNSIFEKLDKNFKILKNIKIDSKSLNNEVIYSLKYI